MSIATYFLGEKAFTTLCFPPRFSDRLFAKATQSNAR